MIKIYIRHSFEHLQLTEHVTKQTKTFSQCFLVNSRVLIKQSLAMCSVWHFEIIKAKTQAWWTKFYSGAQTPKYDCVINHMSKATCHSLNSSMYQHISQRDALPNGCFVSGHCGFKYALHAFFVASSSQCVQAMSSEH